MNDLRFIRDYQTVGFTPVIINQTTPLRTATLVMPERFIVTKMIALVYRKDSVGAFSGECVVIDKPALLTTLRMHSTALDVAPIPIRAAWGTGRHPAKLSSPWAIEKNTALSVEVANLYPPGDPTFFSYDVRFILMGYTPAADEFNKIRAANDASFIRPYATQTLQPANISPLVGVGAANVPFVLNFDTDFVAVRLVGQAFPNVNFQDFTSDGFDPPLTIQLGIKSAILNTLPVPFSALVGDGEFPLAVNPPSLFRAGDLLTATVTNQSTAAGTAVRSFISLVGFEPTADLIRKMEAERLGASQGH